MKTSKILNDGSRMGDPSTDGLDGSLIVSLAALPCSRFSSMKESDPPGSYAHTWSFTDHWQESIAIEQLKTVHWLAIG